MKKIGILTRIDNLNNKKVLYIPLNIYLKLQRKAQIVIIPYTLKTPLKKLIWQIKALDGVVIPGGDKENITEIKLIRFLYKNNIPTLGICLGMQEMALAYKGKLGHFKKSNHKTNKMYAHSIKVHPNSLLYRVIRKKKIVVNSRHQDYVIKTNLFVSAYSDDKVIEAIEDKSKRFFLGVQFHPEDMKISEVNKIFNAFISSL